MSDQTVKPIPSRQNINTRRAAADTTTPLASSPEYPPTEQLPSPPSAQPAPAPTPPTIRISAVLEGFTIELSFAGKIDQLPGYIERLRAAGATPTAQPAQQWSYTPEGLPICPKHGAPMKKREKQGDTWFSHVVTASNGDDCYCRGYRGKDSPGYDY